MAMKCDSCGKGVLYGHNVSHSKRRTQKIFRPNLHTAKVKLGPNKVSLKLCTKCLRMFKKAEKAIAAPKVAEAAATV